MIKRVYIFLLVLLSLITYKLDAQINVLNFKIDYFDVDVLGNLYTVRGYELIKYNSQFQQQATYANLSLGDISSIDASDAMNILVFYSDFAKVLFLDNSLSLKNSVIDLGELGFPNASLACLSYNNGFWVFDPVNQELVRVNQFLEVADRSGNLNQIIQAEINPDQLFEEGNYVYLKDRKKGVFIFDRYGGYLKRLPFIGVDNLQVAQTNVLSFLKNDSLLTYDMRTLNSDTLGLKLNNVEMIKIQSSNTYYLDNKGQLYIDRITIIEN